VVNPGRDGAFVQERAMHRTSTTITHRGTLVKTAIMTHGSVLWTLLPLLLLTLSNLASPVSDASRAYDASKARKLVAEIFATLLRNVRTRACHSLGTSCTTRTTLC